MKLVLPLSVPGGALAGVAQIAQAAEDAGVDGVSYSEGPSDPLLHMTVAAGATERIELLTNIVVAFARSPMTLAVQSRAIQDYSNGRLALGIGSQIKPHIERRFSMPWSAPAARMAEYIAAMRAIWRSWETGEKLDFRGDYYTHTLMTPMFVPPCSYQAPKILLAAVGPRMTEVAGAVADGLLVHPFSTARYFREVALPALERGRVAAGIAPDRVFEIVSSAFVISGEDDEQMAESTARVRRQIAFYGSTPAYRPVLELHGWGDLGDELNRVSKEPDADKWQTMGSLIGDDVLNEFAITGTPDTIGDQVLARLGRHVTTYELNMVGVRDAHLAVEIAHSIQASDPTSA